MPKSFNSARWKKGYNPDLIYASESIANMCKKSVMDPIPHTQHRCRTDYVQGLTDESNNLYEAYKQQYSNNPFDNRTMESGNLLLDKMTEEKRKIWEEVITSTNMTHNSRKVWKTINKLSNDPTSSNPPCLVTASQVAHQLLVNGRGTMPSKPKRPVYYPQQQKEIPLCGLHNFLVQNIENVLS